MPIATIIPCRPNFTAGLTLFRVSADWATYEKALNNLGYETTRPIKVAFLADNFPTDTFTNDYGETFLQKFTDIASQGMAQLAQMAGASTGTQGMINLGQMMSQAGQDTEGILKTALMGAGSAASGLGRGAEKLIRSLNKSEGFGRLIGGKADLINKLVAGHRVDFPQVWRNSAFSPSYTMTVRLYNPKPSNKESTKKHIIGPLAVLLCLAIPRSSDGQTFNWPFFHKVHCSGIYGLDPAVITNIAVVKGGDQQQIADNQSLAIVDVRIDFGSLYNSMLVEDGDGKTITNRPTLRSYLEALEKTKTTEKRKQVAQKMAGVSEKLNIPKTSVTIEQTKHAKLLNKAIAQRRSIALEEESSDRVSSVSSAVANNLIAEMTESGII